MRMNGRSVTMYEYTGNAPRKRTSWTAGLISVSRLRRVLTQALLRESNSATSAIAIECVESSSSTNRACSRMLSVLCRRALSKLAMPCASPSPHET